MDQEFVDRVDEIDDSQGFIRINNLLTMSQPSPTRCA